MTPADTLQSIADHLAQNADPLAAIDHFAPLTLADALDWARRRPRWDECRGHFPEQVIGMAEVVSRRAMEAWYAERVTGAVAWAEMAGSEADAVWHSVEKQQRGRA